MNGCPARKTGKEPQIRSSAGKSPRHAPHPCRTWEQTGIEERGLPANRVSGPQPGRDGFIFQSRKVSGRSCSAFRAPSPGSSLKTPAPISPGRSPKQQMHSIYSLWIICLSKPFQWARAVPFGILACHFLISSGMRVSGSTDAIFETAPCVLYAGASLVLLY